MSSRSASCQQEHGERLVAGHDPQPWKRNKRLTQHAPVWPSREGARDSCALREEEDNFLFLQRRGIRRLFTLISGAQHRAFERWWLRGDGLQAPKEEQGDALASPLRSSCHTSRLARFSDSGRRLSRTIPTLHERKRFAEWFVTLARFRDSGRRSTLNLGPCL